MYQVEHHVGRLVEVKLASPLSLEEVQQFVQKHLAIMQRIPGKYIGVVNLLEAYVFPPPVAEALSKLLAGAASHVERSAFLIGESAVFGLQVERVIRDANSPHRRAFRHGNELVTWLSEILTHAEQRELERFVREATVTVHR
ncbi:MAG: hypothetical protein ACLGH0_03965 [Thermoanaerobaculia bacterium]